MNIMEYIESKEELKSMPFITIYLTIIELIKDGYIEYDHFNIIKRADSDVDRVQP